MWLVGLVEYKDWRICELCDSRVKYTYRHAPDEPGDEGHEAHLRGEEDLADRGEDHQLGQGLPALLSLSLVCRRWRCLLLLLVWLLSWL